jgi:hypothetical protein
MLHVYISPFILSFFPLFACSNFQSVWLAYFLSVLFFQLDYFQQQLYSIRQLYSISQFISSSQLHSKQSAYFQQLASSPLVCLFPFQAFYLYPISNTSLFIAHLQVINNQKNSTCYISQMPITKLLNSSCVFFPTHT